MSALKYPIVLETPLDVLEFLKSYDFIDSKNKDPSLNWINVKPEYITRFFETEEKGIKWLQDLKKME